MKKKVLLLIALLLPLMACAQVTKIKEEADTLNEKAYKYAYQGNFEAAIATIDKAINLCPNDPNYYDSKGEILFNKGDEDGAKNMWDKIISLDPNFGEKKTALYVLLFASETIKEHDSDVNVADDISDRLLMMLKGQDVKIEQGELSILDEKLKKIGNEYGQFTFNQRDLALKVIRKTNEIKKLLAHKAKGEVVYSQGFVINPDKNYIMFPDSVTFECTELWSSGGRSEKWNANTKIQRATIHSIIIPDDIISKKSSKDIEELIKEKLTIVFPQIKRNDKIDHEGIVLYKDDIEVLFGRVSPPNGGEQYRALRVFGSDTGYGKEIGYFNENKYTSVKAIEKAIEAGEKNEALRIANFKKKYGFDPNSSGRQVIKAGRKITALDAWGEWKREKYSKTSEFSDMPWKYSLSIDHGESKCYDLVFNLSVKGYAWVKNGVITSVVWY